MSNARVQAAAEGVPTLSRRTALAMTGAGIVSAITVLSSAAKAAPVELPVRAIAARNGQRSAHGVASPRLRELEKAFKANWTRVKAFEPSLSAAERRHSEARPPRPVDEEWSDDLRARFGDVPVGRLSDPSHPVVAETREIAARNAARRAEYTAACAPLDAELEKSERRYQGLLANADRIGRRALSVPANGVADMMVKIRIHNVNFFDDGEILAVLLKDIARLDRASRKAVQS